MALEPNYPNPTYTELIDQDSDYAAGYVNILYADVLAMITDMQSGWRKSRVAWTYVDAAHYTCPGDYTLVFHKGTKLWWTQTTSKYAYVVSASYSAGTGLTTVTITGGSDYTIANAAITSPYYSYAARPQGFPDWFNYTPTGIAASNVTLTGRFRLSGLECKYKIHAAFTGAITFTTMPTLPITAGAGLTTYDDGDADLAQSGGAAYFDSGTATVIGTLFPNVPSAATVCTITTSAGADISASAPITWANGDALSVWGGYEI